MLKRIAGTWVFEIKHEDSGIKFQSVVDPFWDVLAHQECLKLERQEYIFRFLNPEE